METYVTVLAAVLLILGIVVTVLILVYLPTDSSSTGPSSSPSSSIGPTQEPIQFSNLMTYTGTIRNVGGNDYIRWGQNVDGTADSILLPYKGKVLGYSASFNDTVAITGADPDTWELSLGFVHEPGNPSNTNVSNAAVNYQPFLSRTFTGDEVHNSYPQWEVTAPAQVGEFSAGARLSARSLTSGGSWDFHNGDVVVSVYVLVDSLQISQFGSGQSLAEAIVNFNS
jgi:hypothetical protein